MRQVECILDARARLGESPVWCPVERALYWADLLAPAIHRFDPERGATRTWTLPRTVGSFGLCESGGAVLTMDGGFHHLDFGTGRVNVITSPPELPAGVRFNDGKVSPDGRFFAGTMDEEQLKRPIGALYRLDPDGGCHRLIDGLVVSNGLGWSADGRTLYHSDSRRQLISTYRYDERTGALSNGCVIARPSVAVGRPDGAAVDIEDCYWSAGVSAGVMNRWSPEGALLESVFMPCSAPTMPCFGGADLRTMYVTSLTARDVPGQRMRPGPEGGLFALRVTVPGVPVARFRR